MAVRYDDSHLTGAPRWKRVTWRVFWILLPIALAFVWGFFLF